MSLNVKASNAPTKPVTDAKAADAKTADKKK